MTENELLRWEEFCDWADDNGVGDPRVDCHKDDWEPWFACWQAAVKAVRSEND